MPVVDGSGLLLCGVALATGVALLFVLLSPRVWGESSPTKGAAERSRARSMAEHPAATRPPSGVRVVAVSSTACGIVVDAIVDHGRNLGTPGAPVTLVLEQDDPWAPAPRWLQGWAEEDAVVEVELVPGRGLVPPTIDLRHGERSLRLPILYVQ